MLYSDTDNDNQVNRLASHPTLPLLIAAYEDKTVRLFDLKTGASIANESLVSNTDGFCFQATALTRSQRIQRPLRL
jgi:WD40 repeat protein